MKVLDIEQGLSTDGEPTISALRRRAQSWL